MRREEAALWKERKQKKAPDGQPCKQESHTKNIPEAQFELDRNLGGFDCNSDK